MAARRLGWLAALVALASAGPGAAPPPCEDLSPPATELSLAGPSGSAGWWTGTVQATLAATDDCAVDATQYVLDDGALTAYMAPFAIAGDGAHDLEYRSRDQAGRLEAWNVAGVRIDGSAPLLLPPALFGTPGHAGWWRSAVRVELTCIDGDSGVPPGGLRYGVDAPAATPYTGPFTVSANGPHTLNLRCENGAGIAASASHALPIDTAAPTLHVAVERLTAGPYVVAFTALDPHSGLAGTIEVEEQGDLGLAGPAVVVHRATVPAGTASAGDSFERDPFPGTYCYRASAYDVAGNFGQSVVLLDVGVNGAASEVDGCTVHR